MHFLDFHVCVAQEEDLTLYSSYFNLRIMAELISGSTHPLDVMHMSHSPHQGEEEEEEEEEQDIRPEEEEEVVSGQVGASLPDAWACNRREIGHEGVWTISSAKPGRQDVLWVRGVE